MATSSRNRLGGKRPPAPRTDKLNATQPVLPQAPEKGPPVDDPEKRLYSHNQLPRRDPSGARGNRDPIPGTTRHDRTKR